MPNEEASEFTNTRKPSLLSPHLFLSPGWICFPYNSSAGHSVYYYGIAKKRTEQ